ncbi:MAG: putative metal-binding motif-containing protein, partial [Gemmatimonadota bacterium]
MCAIDPDADRDGANAMACGGTDCDDTDAMRTPGGVEICDDANRDEDCDPSTFGSRDADGDTFVDAACCNDEGGTMRCGSDCNDSRRDAHPGATEACEGIDNDCDGDV